MSAEMLLLNALAGQRVNQVPIWFMRQAGRYLPEYQEVRKQHDFWTMVTTPDLATEVTLQPIRRFGLDAAIIFSDILVILDGLGIGVSFEKGPPELDRCIRDENDLKQLEEAWDEAEFRERLSYYTKALQQTRSELPEPIALLGFAAAPFTLASYMIEGETSKFHARVRAWMHGQPELFERLVKFISKATVSYLQMQIEAGVNAIQFFDSWGDVVPPDVYSKQLMPHNCALVKEISEQVPVIFFCRGASLHRDNLIPLYDSGASALSVDWRLPIDHFGDRHVQGNLDPAVLFSDPDTVARATHAILEQRGHKPGYVFNLGHGIYPGAPVENVEAMVETVQSFRISALKG